MVSSLRRLAADHAALHDSVPPYYLFPPDNELSSDDLTQLTVLLTGPHGTPYSHGLWRLHLKIPDDYPRSPPKASFRTRIWHPNVEESTGSVCVDTLKRDWQSHLTLKDVLVTISCLLIYPNPDSALNSTAGALLQEDYDAFSRQARIMTSIHAPVPQELSDPVKEAKLRGEDAGAVIQELEECTRIPRRPQKESRVHSLRMKKKPDPSQHNHNHQPTQENNTLPTIPSSSTSSPFDDEDENHPSNANANTSATKENDPSLSPSPVKLAPPSPRKSALGKRPLSVLSITPDPDPDFDLDLNHPNREEEEDGDNDGGSYMTASEKNIAANNDSPNRDDSPTRKSPKLSSSSSFSRGARPRANDEIRIFEDNPEPMICATAAVPTVPAGYGGGQAPQPSSHPVSGSKISREPPGGLESGTRAGVGSSSSSSSGPSKRKPRVGIRRL